MLDPNGIFNSPRYDDVWTREYVFAQEFGDTTEYFIALQYYIMREAFQRRIGSALDLDIAHFDSAGAGAGIFRDLSAAERTLITSRSYVAVEERIDTQKSDFGDIYHVTELYGYAPSGSFIKYESVLANSFGWVKSDNALVGSVDYDINWNCFKIADNSALAVGDEVSFVADWSSWGTAYLEPSTVFAVDGTYAYTNPTGGVVYPNGGGERISIDIGMFAWWAKYPEGAVKVDNVWFYKPSTFQAYARTKNRAGGQVVSLARRQTRFAFEPPSVLAQAYCPRNSAGVPEEIFSERTTPTVAQHLQNVGSGTLVLLEDESIASEKFHGLYKITTTYVPCK